MGSYIVIILFVLLLAVVVFDGHLGW